MKYPVYLALGTLAILPLTLSAQSPVDAYNLSQTELRGTARFMSMGGAFTALGGDLSTLNQNPAGIGIYRSSEVGLTLDRIYSVRKPTVQSGIIPILMLTPLDMWEHIISARTARCRLSRGAFPTAV